MEPVLTIIIAIFGSTGFWALIQKLLERKSALRQMVFGIGYERLISACREYIEAGWIDLDELEELDKHLFQPYKAMGGNGTAELLMEKVSSSILSPFPSDRRKGASVFYPSWIVCMLTLTEGNSKLYLRRNIHKDILFLLFTFLL